MVSLSDPFLDLNRAGLRKSTDETERLQDEVEDAVAEYTLDDYDDDLPAVLVEYEDGDDEEPVDEEELALAHRGALGVAAERLVFAEMLPRAEHLTRMAFADLGLDTHFYNGHTTTSDALWAGLPVVAMQGRHFASRVSASLLTAAGVPELITQSPDQYAELALHLATNPDELWEIRSKIERNRSNCALFDTVSITRDLESAYTEMWRRFSRGEAASTIKVASLG